MDFHLKACVYWCDRFLMCYWCDGSFMVNYFICWYVSYGYGSLYYDYLVMKSYGMVKLISHWFTYPYQYDLWSNTSLGDMFSSIPFMIVSIVNWDWFSLGLPLLHSPYSIHFKYYCSLSSRLFCLSLLHLLRQPFGGKLALSLYYDYDHVA